MEKAEDFLDKESLGLALISNNEMFEISTKKSTVFEDVFVNGLWSI